MKLPSMKSVRVKLIGTTLLVMAVVLMALVFLTDFSARKALLSSIDRDLELRATDHMRMRRGPNQPPQNFMDGGQTPPNPDGFGQGRNGQDPFGPGRERRGPPPRNAFMTMPRILSVDGSLRPNQPNDPAYDPEAVKIAAATGKHFSEVRIDNGVRRVLTLPIFVNGRVNEVVQVAYPMGDILATLGQLRYTLLTIVIPIGLLLAGLASLFVVDRFLIPLRKLTEDANRVSAGNLCERVTEQGDDEFAELGQTLNSMLSRIEDAFAKEQFALAQQKRFTADASHELKTPLTVVKANLGLLQHAKASPEEQAQWVEAIDGAANRMTKLVQDLLVLARNDHGAQIITRDPVDVSELIQEAVSLMPNQEVNPVLDLPSKPVFLAVSHDDMVRVITNLLDNASRHSESSVPVEITLQELGSEVHIQIKDHGKGISPEHIPHLFERFYRSDMSRNSATGGTGLGLAICQSIVESHGGTISVVSELGVGTTFTVILPNLLNATQGDPLRKESLGEQKHDQ